MILCQRAEDRREVRSDGLDRGKKRAVLSPVMFVKRNTEPVAVEEKIPACVISGKAVANRALGDRHGIAEA